MKTVIVFDTEDEEGMKNTVKVISHLASEYIKDKTFFPTYQIPFGKIELIKHFRNYATMTQDDDFGRLRHAKAFVGEIIKTKTPF